MVLVKITFNSKVRGGGRFVKGGKKVTALIGVTPDADGVCGIELGTSDPLLKELCMELRGFGIKKKIEIMRRYTWEEVDSRFLSVFFMTPCKKLDQTYPPKEKIDIDYFQYQSLERVQKELQRFDIENNTLENILFIAIDNFLRESHLMQIAKRLDPAPEDKIGPGLSSVQMRNYYRNISDESGYTSRHHWKRIRHDWGDNEGVIRNFIKNLTDDERKLFRIVFNFSPDDFKNFMRKERLSDQASYYLSYYPLRTEDEYSVNVPDDKFSYLDSCWGKY